MLSLVTCFAVVFSSLAIAEDKKPKYMHLRLEGNNTLVLTGENKDCVYGRYAFIMNQFGKHGLSACWNIDENTAEARVSYADGDVMKYPLRHFNVIFDKDNKVKSVY